MDCLFFLNKTVNRPKIPDLSQDYETVLWRPSLFKIKPAGLSWRPFAIWWLFHISGIFKNRRYAILLIYQKGQMIHHSCIFPKYSRFPFMDKTDLQVGDTWTAPEARGKGLAVYALTLILKDYANDTNVWYLTTPDNTASIRVAEKCGFSIYAKGRRYKCLGISLLGNYNFSENDIL